MTKIQREISSVARQISRNYRPEKIILFGSAAAGTTNKDSDIDLFIIKDTDKRFIDRISDVLRSCTYSIPIEPIVYTAQEVKKRLAMGDFFVKNILKNGKVLYEQKLS